jgi:hypothetical protein
MIHHNTEQCLRKPDTFFYRMNSIDNPEEFYPEARN